MISEFQLACLIAYGLYLNRPRTICAWCKKTLWPGMPSTAVAISHGICPECEKEHFGVVTPRTLSVPSVPSCSKIPQREVVEALADDFLSDLLDQIGDDPVIDL